MSERPILFSGEMVRAILDGRKTQTRRVIKNWPPKIRLPLAVRGDWPIGHMYRAEPGIYQPFSNPLGALSVAVGDHKLGIKPGEFEWVCPYGQPGDRLWVRETWKIRAWREDGRMAIDYKASPELTHTPWVTLPDDDYGEKFNDMWMGLTDQLIAIKWPMNPDTERYEWEPGKCPLPWKPSIFLPRWVSRINLEIVSVRVERVQDISSEDCIAEGMERPRSFEMFGTIGDEFTKRYQDRFKMLWNSVNAKRSYPWESNPWVWVIEFRKV